MKKLLAFGIGSSFIGMVLLIVGIATVRWMTADFLILTRDLGLWQFCDTSSGVTDCEYFPMGGLSRNEHTFRAFAVIGAILAIAGVGTAIGGGSKDADGGKNGGGGIMIAAGVCGMIAAGVFTLNIGIAAPQAVYGYSFYLTWAQALFTIGGGIAIIVGGQQGSTPVQPVGGGPATGQPVASPV